VQAEQCIEAFKQAVAALEQAAAGAIAGLAQADSSQAAADQQQQLAHRLQAALDGLSQEHTTVRRSLEAVVGSNSAQRAVLLRQLLQPAADLGAALLAYYELPDQRAAERLELARIAATRRCAYLRCANMEADSARIKKCSACKAVRYCSTACSHADWRAGHKRVCKALGPEGQESS
jgi:hypothetical protein